MNALNYTLVSDGSSDRMLLPILSWVLQQAHPTWTFNREWADLHTVRSKSTSLTDRIRLSVEWFPCKILFIHRDAELAQPEKRHAEIDAALRKVTLNTSPIIIHVIPIRMTEAWLLFDEAAIRQAAGRPGNKPKLVMPALKQLETLPDPKATLFDLLTQASNLTGRRAKNFRPHERAYRMAELIDDFSPLRSLSAFRALEADVQALSL